MNSDITSAGHYRLDSEKDLNQQEVPKFYKNDITSILRERNQLKEKVLELEEEIVSLKMKISKLSNIGTSTSSPNDWSVQRVRSGAFLDTSLHKSAAIAMLQKTLKSYTDRTQTHDHVSDVEITGYKKKGRHYVYVIKLTWSDGQRYEIYRRYGEFFTFQHTLLQMFPEESGRGNSSTKIIPSLPTIDNILSLFGRTNTESVMKTRLATISEYCRILLLHLDEHISRSPHVLSFFRPTIGDTQLTRLKRRVSGIDLSMLSVYPQDMPAGSLFEEFVVLADYEATETGEISAKAGDKVKVMKKENSGWWLVTKVSSKGEVGYISSNYLKLYKDQDIWKSMSSDDLQKYLGFACEENLGEDLNTGEEKPVQLKYVAVEDYHTEDPCQLSLEKDEMVLVVEMSEDGWWLVFCNKKQGWVPASYLQPLSEEGLQQEMETLTKQEDRPVEAASCGAERGEEYLALASYSGEQDGDISFLKGATVEVMEKSHTGWWVVRHNEKVGMAPASFLQLPSSQVELSIECLDVGQPISGITVPPPRSKLFHQGSMKKIHKLTRSLRDEEQIHFCDLKPSNPSMPHSTMWMQLQGRDGSREEGRGVLRKDGQHLHVASVF